MSTRKREQHGLSHSGEYHSWAMMLQRCYNPKHLAYDRYAGRGITVCDRWRTSFVAFLEDMGEKPDGMSLDRIDNDGDYTPENCRWATRRQQARNTRRTKRVFVEGESRSAPDVAAEMGISNACYHSRLSKGWSAEEASGLEPRCDPRSITIDGITLTQSGWAKRLGLSRQALNQRIARGWDMEKALSIEPLAPGDFHLSINGPRGRKHEQNTPGSIIAASRYEMGWTQSQLADAIGMSCAWVSSVERGKSELTLTLACKLANVLKLNLNDLSGE